MRLRPIPQLLTSLPLLLGLGCGGGGGGEGDDEEPVCGDGVLEGDEACDDGNPTDGDGCDQRCELEPAGPTAVMRFTELELVDPHIYAFQILDVTSTVNNRIKTAMRSDVGPPADPGPDGDLDLSVALRVPDRAEGPRPATAPVELSFPLCTAGDDLRCRPNPDPDFVVVEAPSREYQDVCVDALADTIADPDHVLTETAAPCFASDPITFRAPIGTFDLEVRDAVIGASYDGDDALITGVVRGFLSRATAEAAVIPEAVEEIGGETVASLLAESDLDRDEDGTEGWYLYLNFEAARVEFDDAE